MRVDVEVPERSDDGERGVVDEEADVEVDEIGEDVVEVVAVGKVCSQRACLYAGRSGDVVRDLLCEIDAPGDQHDVEPPAGAPSCECLTEPFRCPGDYGPRTVALCERCSRLALTFVVTGRMNGCSRHIRINTHIGTIEPAPSIRSQHQRQMIARERPGDLFTKDDGDQISKHHGSPR